jgi:hypothetical protein
MPLTVSMWSGVPLSTRPVPFSPTCVVYLCIRTFACVPHCVARMRPALCDPTPIPGRPRGCRIGLLAPGRAAGLRIWHPARPRLGFPIPIPSARVPSPLCPPFPQPFPPVSPERGGAFGSPRRLIDFRSGSHVTPQSRLKLAPQPGFLPRRRRGRSLPSPCARLPSLGPRMSSQAPQSSPRSLVKPGFVQETVFFQVPRIRVHPASSGPSEQIFPPDSTGCILLYVCRFVAGVTGLGRDGGGRDGVPTKLV